MSIFIKFWIIFWFIFLSACTISKSGEKQNDGQKLNKIIEREGKCFQKCLIPDQYVLEEKRFPIYKGKNQTAPLQSAEIEIKPSTSAWVKKGYQVCLEQTPPVVEKITYLLDTIQYREFEYRTISIKKLVASGGFLRETEIVCQEDLDTKLAMKISLSLSESGFLNQISTTFDAPLNQAIEKYERTFGLPVGAISIELLHHLRVER